jgi:hypothetical protein
MLKMPKNYRITKTRCCATCERYGKFSEELSYENVCQRDIEEREVSIDSGNSDEYTHVCDYHKFNK